MAASKLTIDLNDKNKETLEQLKADLRWPYGNTINTLISTFCQLPDDIKKELLEIIKPKIRELYKEMDIAGDFEFAELSKKCQAYTDIVTFLNDGNHISLESLESEPTMKKYPIKDGYLICPDNWIILNPEQAKDMKYAGVVECRNSAKYNIPHYVFLTNSTFPADISE